jgi:hypothetical protein
MRGIAMRLRGALHELSEAKFLDRRQIELPADAAAMLEAGREAITVAGGKVPAAVIFSGSTAGTSTAWDMIAAQPTRGNARPDSSKGRR